MHHCSLTLDFAPCRLKYETDPGAFDDLPPIALRQEVACNTAASLAKLIASMRDRRHKYTERRNRRILLELMRKTSRCVDTPPLTFFWGSLDVTERNSFVGPPFFIRMPREQIRNSSIQRTQVMTRASHKTPHIYCKVLHSIRRHGSTLSSIVRNAVSCYEFGVNDAYMDKRAKLRVLHAGSAAPGCLASNVVRALKIVRQAQGGQTFRRS
eukprot:6180026-Pleurochrysis_carterae.AAC.1